MSNSTSTAIKNVIKVLCMLVIIAAGLTGIIYFNADVGMLLILLVFMLFFVLLPGSYILTINGLQGDHVSTALSRSFFTGFALNVVLYYLAALTGTGSLLFWIAPVMSLLFAVRLIRSGDKRLARRALSVLKKTPASFYAFAACVFLCSIFTTQFTYIPPDHSAFSAIKLDFGYHAGIVNALSAGFPPADPWVDGLTIEYHYYSELLYSIPMRIFGLPSEKMLLSGTPYVITPVFSISLYAFFREFMKKKDRSGLYCLAFHFSNMFVLKQFAHSWFMYHIYSNINNAGLGLACLLTAMPLLKEWDRGSASPDKRFNTKGMIFLAAITMLMTGIKGPMAIVFVCAILGTFIVGLLLRKVSMKNFAATVLSLMSFALIYVYVIGGQHDNATGGSLMNPGEVTDLLFFKDRLMDILSDMSKPVAWAILLGAFMVFYLSAFLLPFVIGYIRELILVISGKKDFVFSNVTVYAVFLVGLISMFLLNFAGHSQVYLGFVSLAMVPAIAFWFFEDFPDKKPAAVKAVSALFILCLVISSCTMIQYMISGATAGSNRLHSRNEDTAPYRSVTPAEYEGLTWLRDNTPKDSLIASDRYFSVPLEDYSVVNRKHNTHFAYAIYSQRRQYLEGSGFSINASDVEMRQDLLLNNKKIYAPENTDRSASASSLGIDYVVQSLRFTPDAPDFSEDGLELCFSNDEMRIYKVTESN